MTPALRKLALTAHIISSVGWWGAIAAFLALAITGATSPDASLVRGAYLSMNLTARGVIVPLSLLSLLTGVIESLGTSWGLIRHYWVLIKLVMTVLSTAFLLVHLRPIDEAAHAAAATDLSPADLLGLRTQLVADASAGSLVLLVATVLGVYKPRGMTAYGWRKQRARQLQSP